MALKEEEAFMDCSFQNVQCCFPLLLSASSKVSHNATLASTTVTNFPLMEGAMEAFSLWKIQCSGLWPLLYPYRYKGKTIMSARYK